MTDITELAQRMKAAAVRAKAATEDYVAHRMSITVCLEECKEFNDLSDGPDNILALVEALEKSYAERDEYKDGERSTAVKSVELQDEIYRLNARIVELESRTVNIKFAPIQVEELGNVRDGKKHPYMFGAGYNSAVIHCESVIRQELDAKGIKWEGE